MSDEEFDFGAMMAGEDGAAASEEHRIDKSDGLAYPFSDFIAAYAGDADSQWMAAPSEFAGQMFAELGELTADGLLDAMDMKMEPAPEEAAAVAAAKPAKAAEPEREIVIEEDEGNLEASWGAVLKAGWMTPDDTFDDGDSLVGRRLFVLDEGFGTVMKHKARKRGGGMTTIDFGAIYGKKTLMLRLAGNTGGGTAWMARAATFGLGVDDPDDLEVNPMMMMGGGGEGEEGEFNWAAMAEEEETQGSVYDNDAVEVNPLLMGSAEVCALAARVAHLPS